VYVARNEIVRLVDDLDGSEAVDTVSFGLDDSEYEIDLNDEHIDQLRGGLMPYIKAGRKVGAGPSRRQASAAPKRSSRDDLGEVRAWLVEHGYPLKDRGRLPVAWIADYDSKSPNPPQVVAESTEAGEQPKRNGSAVEAPVFQAV
jgi:nucleoid-associated protein Lsr2